MLDVALGGATDVPAATPDNVDDLPMRRLSAAVIERAVIDAASGGSTRYGPDASEALVSVRARRWLFSDNDAPGSFDWWCQWLGLEPDYLRDGVVDKYGDRILEGVSLP